MSYLPQNFHQYQELHVAQTIAQPASYAKLPTAANGWPVDDKVRSVQLNLAYEKAQFLQKISTHHGIKRLVDNIFRTDVGKHQMKRVTATNAKKRDPSATTSSSTEQYHLRELQFDWMLTYQELQAWAHLGPGELAKRIREMFSISLGNDLLDLALNGNGEADEVETKADFYKLQKGWIARIKDHNLSKRWSTGSNDEGDPTFVGKKAELGLQNAAVAASSVSGQTTFTLPEHQLQVGMAVTIHGSANYAGAYRVKAVDDDGNTFDITKAHQATTFAASDLLKTHPNYTSMDHLAQDFIGMIPLELRGGLEVLLSDNLCIADRTTLFETAGNDAEKRGAAHLVTKNLAGKPTTPISLLQDGTVIVTPPKNLHLYVGSEAHRKMQDRPEYGGVVTWDTLYVDFRIGRYDNLFGASNVKLI